MDPPSKEIFNFMYEKATDYTVFIKRGTSLKHYYGLAPIIILNIKLCTIRDYGESAMAKPYIYVTDHEYQWSDSSLFAMVQLSYDFATRVARGDMDVSESTKFFLKLNVFRGSLTLLNIDWQSIMFGDAWSNPLLFSFDAQNETVIFDNNYLDLDGALMETYFPISTLITNSHINLTNYEYGLWNDYRWNCTANNATEIRAYIIVENTLINGYHNQALYNFFYLATMDHFILRNNTFDDCTYLDMETRTFLDVHPQTLCDPDSRTQHIFIDDNKFLNLKQSNLIFAVNYMKPFNGVKIFSMQNNQFRDSTSKHT